MNVPDPISTGGQLDEIAAGWLYERAEGFTPERAEAFAVWCHSDPRHARAIARVEQTWNLLDEMPAVRAALETRIARDRDLAEPRAGAAIFRFRRFAWAAGLAAAVVIGFGIWRETSSDRSAEHYVTDDAAQRSLVLSDGSVMDLNVGSEVSVRFTAAQRRVILLRGEAHFEVAHNAARPFIVTADDVSMRAVGTAFDVRLANKEVNVFVVEGKVEVSRDVAILERPPAMPPPLLQAGEFAHVPRDNRLAAPHIERVDASSMQTMLTWQNPMTSFADVALRDVLVRFNRRNAVQLILQDADLGERKIGGMIALDQVDAFVRLLVQDGDVVAERRPAGEILLRRAR
jgi:transmembrane sensor